MEKPRPATPNPNLNVPSEPNEPPKHQRRVRRYAFWIVVIIVAIIVVLVIHHIIKQRAANKRPPAKPIPVVVATAKTSDVPVYIPALGQVTPTYNVTVRTQINGRLLHVYFTEGQIVKMGQLIAEIDPRPYIAQLVQFQGQLERDQAQLRNARIDLGRYRILAPIGAVSKQVYVTQIWLVKQLEGTVKLDQGQIDEVKVNLNYCYITSPVDGRIGLRLVDPGNYVQTTDANGLVVINTITPITVVFSIPEDDVPQVMEKVNAGKTLLAQAYDRQQNKLLETGKLFAVDSQIDTTTGTVKLKASFANKNYVLFPDQFVNIQLRVDSLHNVTVIPTAAVQHGPQGTFVFLLNNNNTVSVKVVTTGITSGSDTVITTGVTPGQTVVIDGIDKLTDGAPVTVTNEAGKTTPPLLNIPVPSYGYSYPHGSGP